MIDWKIITIIAIDFDFAIAFALSLFSASSAAEPPDTTRRPGLLASLFTLTLDQRRGLDPGLHTHRTRISPLRLSVSLGVPWETA